MKIALVVIGLGFAVLLYTAWLNRLFLRCPQCRKIGSWRFDSVEPAVEQKDQDGALQSTRQVRACRKCGNKVVETWSDHDGRRLSR